MPLRAFLASWDPMRPAHTGIIWPLGPEQHVEQDCGVGLGREVNPGLAPREPAPAWRAETIPLLSRPSAPAQL